MRKPVILFQPPNQVGLGHMSRLSAIAKTVRTEYPSFETPFAVAGASHSFLEGYGLPYIAIPPDLDSSTSRHWRSWPIEDRTTIATSISFSLLKGLGASLVVFDCFPSLAMVRAAVHLGVKMTMVVREMRSMDGYLQTVKDAVPYLTSVIVAHERWECPLPQPLEVKATYVGRIARRAAKEVVEEVNEKRYRIVVSGGGGGTRDALRLYNLAIDAISSLYDTYLTEKSLLITGPLFTQWYELKTSNAVTTIPFEPEVLERFEQAELVITFAGYNTIAEISAIKTRVICMPSRAPYDDQKKRAIDSAASNPNFRILSEETVAGLASLIQEALDIALVDVQPARSPGALRAAQHLHSLVV